MVKEKYAVIFPEIQTVGNNTPVSIFSERTVGEATKTFSKTFDAFENLLDYVEQKNKTKEFGKQLAVEKAALDVGIENFREQKQIEFKQYSDRLRIQAEKEKEAMKMELEKIRLEVSARIADFSVSFEEAMKENQLFMNLIREEHRILKETENYISTLQNDFSQHKAYVMYCELRRKSFELIDSYLKEMI